MSTDTISPIPLPEQFSATIARSDALTSRIYVDGERKRVENDTPNGLEVVVCRPDLGVVYTLHPEEKTYFETPFIAEVVAYSPDDQRRWLLLGEETINGRQCLKYQVLRKGDTSGVVRELCYVDPDLGMRVRIVTFNRLGRHVLTCDYQDVHLGPPPPDLFDVPGSYTRVGG